jgi:hypothetical protein
LEEIKDLIRYLESFASRALVVCQDVAKNSYECVNIWAAQRFLYKLGHWLSDKTPMASASCSGFDKTSKANRVGMNFF